MVRGQRMDIERGLRLSSRRFDDVGVPPAPSLGMQRTVVNEEREVAVKSSAGLAQPLDLRQRICQIEIHVVQQSGVGSDQGSLAK